jgi:hypothetical protein
VSAGQLSEIRGLARSKVFTTPGEMILRKTRLDFEAITPGQGRLQAFGSDQLNPLLLYTWSANPGLGKFSEATSPLSGANQPLGAPAETQNVSRARMRVAAMSFQVTTTSGRIRLRRCLAEMSLAAG